MSTESTREWKERMAAKAVINLAACPRCKTVTGHYPGCSITPELAMQTTKRKGEKIMAVFVIHIPDDEAQTFTDLLQASERDPMTATWFVRAGSENDVARMAEAFHQTIHKTGEK